MNDLSDPGRLPLPITAVKSDFKASDDSDNDSYWDDSKVEDSEEDSEEDSDSNIIHDNDEDLSEWLKKYPPSRLHEWPDIVWLRIEPKAVRSGICTINFENMLKEWEELKLSKQPIDFSSLSKLGIRNNCIGGMWIFFVETGYKVDLLWQKVATQFKQGVLSDLVVLLRVSQADKTNQHVVVLNHADFTNKESVFELENALRVTGIKCKLMYKPEIYTYLGIYAKNEYNIRPTIYASNYDVLRKTSKITIPLQKFYGKKTDNS